MTAITTRRIALLAAVAASLGLTACNKAEEAADHQANAVEQSSEAAADAMENQADQMSGAPSEAMEEKADQVRDAGDAKSDAIENQASKSEKR